MPTKILLADESLVMRKAIIGLLREESDAAIVEASTFAETIALTAALRPDVVLLDLHLPDEHEYSPEFVKIEIGLHKPCIIGLSFWDDDEAHALAVRLGARTLLDKTKLYSQLFPAIKNHCPDRQWGLSRGQKKLDSLCTSAIPPLSDTMSA